jgi:hypothetical protein
MNSKSIKLWLIRNITNNTKRWMAREGGVLGMTEGGRRKWGRGYKMKGKVERR